MGRTRLPHPGIDILRMYKADLTPSEYRGLIQEHLWECSYCLERLHLLPVEHADELRAGLLAEVVTKVAVADRDGTGLEATGGLGGGMAGDVVGSEAIDALPHLGVEEFGISVDVARAEIRTAIPRGSEDAWMAAVRAAIGNRSILIGRDNDSPAFAELYALAVADTRARLHPAGPWAVDGALIARDLSERLGEPDVSRVAGLEARIHAASRVLDSLPISLAGDWSLSPLRIADAAAQLEERAALRTSQLERVDRVAMTPEPVRPIRLGNQARMGFRVGTDVHLAGVLGSSNVDVLVVRGKMAASVPASAEVARAYRQAYLVRSDGATGAWPDVKSGRRALETAYLRLDLLQPRQGLVNYAAVKRLRTLPDAEYARMLSRPESEPRLPDVWVHCVDRRTSAPLSTVRLNPDPDSATTGAMLLRANIGVRTDEGDADGWAQRYDVRVSMRENVLVDDLDAIDLVFGALHDPEVVRLTLTRLAATSAETTVTARDHPLVAGASWHAAAIWTHAREHLRSLQESTLADLRPEYEETDVDGMAAEIEEKTVRLASLVLP